MSPLNRNLKLISNGPLKAVSFLIAIVLWFVVLGSRHVEITKDIPLEMVTPSDLVVSNEIPDKISFRLSGPKAFLRNIMNRREQPIRVNLSHAKPGLVTYRFFSENIQVPLGVKVVLINPTMIVARLEPTKTKEVPLRLVTVGEPSPGHHVRSIRLLQNRIRIKGPDSRLDNIAEVKTLPMDLGSLLDSGEKELGLDFSTWPGVSALDPRPRVHFDVVSVTSHYKIKGIPVEVKGVGSQKWHLFPSEVSAYIEAPSDGAGPLSPQAFKAMISVAGLARGPHEVPVSLSGPPHVRILRILPQRIKISLE